WTVSEPGNFCQLPQVLNGLGYRGALMRIHGPGQGGSLTPRADAGSVWWQGPDGSRILAVPEYEQDRLTPKASVPNSMWIMTRYRNTRQARGSYTLDDLWAWKLAQEARGISPVVMSKDDDQNNQPGNNNLCMTSGHLLAADAEGDPRFRWVSAEELFAELPPPERILVADPNLFETRKESFCDYGYLGNADWLADLHAERALHLADWAVAMAGPRAHEAAEGELRRAWSAHLAAQNHDLSLKRSLDVSLHLQYDARRMAEGVREQALEALFGGGAASRGGGAIAVCNPLGWERRDYAQVEIPEALADEAQPYVEGQPIPWEVVHRGAGRATMGFVAHVPALGYRLYELGPRADAAAQGPTLIELPSGGVRIEAKTYTAELAPSGGLAGLWTAEGRQVADKDSLRLCGGVNGQSARSAGSLRVMQRGPVSVVVRESGMVGPYHAYEMGYRFVAGLPTIRLQLYLAAHYTDGDPGAPGRIDETDKLGLCVRPASSLDALACTRYQPLLVWPYDLAMDPVFAAPYWVDLSGGEAGLTCLNEGAIGYRYDADQRSLSNILAYGRVSELRWELGLLPHDGDWRAGGAHRWGLGFGHPLHARYLAARSEGLPPVGQLCQVAPDHVTVSSAFRAGGRNYVRLYEHEGAAADVQLLREGAPLRVQAVDLRLRATTAGLTLPPYGLGTYALPDG
ncbi:MAG: hypothetical protein FJZ90_16015, partial [Chloroflexi bacterium]|nr:hypothetical protein [Chloroflexota bacterium]